MKRKSIVFSLPSLILLAILFSALGLDFVQHGGRAFSPGELSARSNNSSTAGKIASHSEFENECSLCHQPLRTRQAELCMECHTDIAEEIQAANGSHGKIPAVFTCYECHSDHKGREFDPIHEALAKFDHSKTSFSLRWHQIGYDTLPMSCESCHTLSPEFGFVTGSCEECHIPAQREFMEKHMIDFGVNCTDCHDGRDQMTEFNHQNTNFPLDGRHLEVDCAACHQSADFEPAPLDCSGCHSEPAVHLSQFDSTCSACHNTHSWSPASFDGQPFDHAKETGFSLAKHHLDYSGDIIACRDCHSLAGYDIPIEVCIACHSSEAPDFMEEHTGQFGDSCLDCHDGVDRLSDFDHESRFPLLGRHAEIECEACHTNQIFRGTSSECVQCHAEPEIHAGFFGLKCEYCHNADSWTPAQLSMHIFPLDHGEGAELDCQMCHVQVYQEYTCYGCHEHQPDEIAESHEDLNLAPMDLLDCSTCHPTGDVGPEDPDE